MPDDTIDVLTRDGKAWRVNRARFEDMAQALMAVLPDGPPGMTVPEAKAALLPRRDPAVFAGGDKAGWWLKAVQPDHEARGLIARADTLPVRLYRPQGMKKGAARAPFLQIFCPALSPCGAAGPARQDPPAATAPRPEAARRRPAGPRKSPRSHRYPARQRGCR
ncbi:MAG: hypothetical protein HLUCCA08_04030 [Rhodobacteraceae bacterium HLUCCA08]|nr:MAG: hypothetical protein HLUCCA08_04030 [Rhodobacteraceae bacterium HLUCCA08]